MVKGWVGHILVVHESGLGLHRFLRNEFRSVRVTGRGRGRVRPWTPTWMAAGTYPQSGGSAIG